MIDKKLNIFKSKFGIGELVYIKTDPDKDVRIVTQVKFTADGGCLYLLAKNTTETWHYAIEITYEKPFLNY